MKRYQSTRDRGGEPGASVDIIPLIDVVFLLLCFFVLLTMSMVYQQGIPVDLAESTSANARSENRPIVVTVKGDGSVYLGKRKVENSALTAELKDRLRGHEKLRVVVQADEQARHQQVISVVDRVRKAGIGEVIFSVKPGS